MPAPYLVTQAIEAQAGAHPDQPATFCNALGVTTYRDLDQRSSQIANLLADAGVARQDRVLFCLSRSSRFVAGVVGTLKLGAIYVPVPDSIGEARLQDLCADSEPAAIVCDLKAFAAVAGLVRRDAVACRALLVIDADIAPPLPAGDTVPCRILTWADVGRASAARPAVSLISTDIAYLLYTSGSTGKPKGVAVSHAALWDYCRWAVEYLEMGPGTRVLGTAPFHFDMSVFDIFATITSGATLYVADPLTILFPKTLVTFIERHRITLWKGVSSLLSHVVKARALKPASVASLRHVLFAGEKLPTRYLVAWMESAPGARFYNAYGPTEATGVSAIHHIEAVPASADEVIPIGRPCDNIGMFLLDEAGRPVGPGEVGGIGELYIRGTCLASGYWRNPQATAASFVPNPLQPGANDVAYRTGDLARYDEAGNLVFVARADEQIKFQGYRIELQEICFRVLAFPGVSDAAVLFIALDEGGEEEIVAFVEPAGGMQVDVAVLQAHLGQHLPSYMLPRRVHVMPELQRNERGKVDRRGLVASYRGARR